MNDSKSRTNPLQPPLGMGGKGLVFAFAGTIFLSAFLLFQVQPLLSKTILPWFGGTPSVWTTCMLFFQTLLFAGYAYAHLVNRHLSQRMQMWLHVGLLLSACLLLPIVPSDSWKPTGGENPTLRIVLLLSASVGLPFFILSSTGPLLQSWFARASDGASPYRLYALSNIGSLLALLSYPFLVEPAWDSLTQAHVWSWGFAAFGVLCAGCALITDRVAKPQAATPRDAACGLANEQPPTNGVRVLWFLLSMAASTMLLATTNQVCMDVASVPFLWVMPLTLYLMTFILCFDSDKWYSRKWFAIASAVSIAGVCVVMLKGAGGSLIAQVLIYFSGLFFTAMVCHGELVNLKPSPRYLTAFYLIISAGGAAGGLFVGLLAPMIFPTFLEMHIALFGVWALAMVVFFRDTKSVLYNGRPRWAWGLMLVGSFVLAGTLRIQAGITLDHSVEVSRNFYGVLRIEERDADDAKRHRIRLVHGRILHGLQFKHADLRRTPTTYYGHQAAVGHILNNKAAKPKRHVGVVGLGVGTVATYAKPGDNYRFYEINPDVVRLAKKYFTYLSDCQGKQTIVVADARQAMERESDQKFDVLIVDAFSGDAIPAHLVTEEAFDIYRRHLKPDGVLAFHISNLYFDLQPLVAAGADRFGWKALTYQSKGDKKTGTKPAVWMVMAKDINRPLFDSLRKVGKAYDGPRVKWTDRRSSLWEIRK